MSKADERFKELRYLKRADIWKEDNKIHTISYSGNETSIEFLIDTKHILIGSFINMQELQAINEKCKELGWI